MIVGAGIVGLSTAYQLRRCRPSAEITVLEKEPDIALHQTGRNSGVIHSGLYYKPGSAKALNCRRGRAALLAFCADHGVPHEVCGKVVVAAREEELPRLHDLYQRGRANGVQLRHISVEELHEIEPHANGVGALHVPEAGIVDYRQMCRVLARESQGQLEMGAGVTRVKQEPGAVIVETNGGVYRADVLINCAGLYSDRLCKLAAGSPPLQIVPFKGEYYEVRESARRLCRHLIYPVPDPAFPFLGVHLTRMIGGGVEVGPNAVLALGREAYGKLDFDLGELAETLKYRGFQRLAARHWRMGVVEMARSVFKPLFVKALQRLCPEITSDDLVPAPCGIRAQALRPDGALEDDFRIEQHGRTFHVLNAPSPAATASLAIGVTVANTVIQQMGS